MKKLNDPKLFRLDDSGKSPAFFSLTASPAIDRTLVEELKTASKEVAGRNVRICLHEGPHSVIQDMIVYSGKNAYYRPHRHLSGEESYLAIDGKAVVIFFDSSGAITQKQELSPDAVFFLRVSAGQFHSVIPLTEAFIYHEYRVGPFSPGATEFAPWSPDEKDKNAVIVFTNKLLEATNQVPHSK